MKNNLNEKQLEAVSHSDGPLLILAGAGAGKTKTITHRIANLIQNGVNPEEILAVTFTNKAAKEMRERVLATIAKLHNKSEQGLPFVSTFHALGTYIIRENARALGLNRHFSILDEGDAISIIKDAIRSIGLDPKEYEPRKIKSIISREKGKNTNPVEYIPNNSLEKIVREVWPIYEDRKKKENGLDFDDLLIKALDLLEKNEHIRTYYQDKWRYIHIDEYQDTNEVQYKITKILSSTHQNICVVGDADQNIYSWRGANLRNILQFEKDYKGAKVILLEENYRSTQNILEAANTVIKKNKFRPEKNLFTKNKTGEKISLYEALEETDEADFVATKILEIMDSNKNSVAEIAILYRANFQSRALEEAMLRYNISYQVLGTKFFERKEVKDTLAYLRAALNPKSLSDIKRIINFPARGIGKATLAKLFSNEKESLPIKTKIKIDNFYNLLEIIKNKIFESTAEETIKFLVKKSGIEDELLNSGEEGEERLENIKELATLALKYRDLPGEAGIEKLLEEASLATDQDDLDRKNENKQAVKLMTVHASKGLEFNYVFITGLEEGLFPHERSGVESDQEEERRLFYVALTRAKEKLYLSFANFRTIFGSRNINMPSQFLEDIPDYLIELESGEKNTKIIFI